MNPNFGFLNRAETSTRWNQVTQNHILFQTDKIVGSSRQGCFGKHLRRFLETGSRDEAGTLYRCLGNTQKLSTGSRHLGLGTLGDVTTESFDLSIGLFQNILRNNRASQRIRCRLCQKSAST